MILGAIGLAVAGAALMLPWPAGGAAAVVAVLLLTHPSIGRAVDAPVRVLLRAIPLLAATAIMLRIWELDRWRSADPLRSPPGVDRYRVAYAAELLAAGCLILAILCAAAAIIRSLSRPGPDAVTPAASGRTRSSQPSADPVTPTGPGEPRSSRPHTDSVTPTAPGGTRSSRPPLVTPTGPGGRRSLRPRAAAVALTASGGLLLTAAAWAAVRIAVAGGEMLRVRAEAAEITRGAAFLQPGLRYSAASAAPVLDTGTAVLAGAALLGVMLTVLAGVRLAAPDRN